ncbi:MAG: PadR family transcriptional regulator [Clostridiales bacterium]|jgi:PadR family transcriptional regulator PadR|nr:PadR family transcriptional regulator [Clostridiales bacterium]
MDAQFKKGLLDACVLSVLSKEESYGYKIISDLKDIIEISESTLYPILKRLEAGGFLTTFTRQYGGRLRKYYAITRSGRHKLVDCEEDWREMRGVYQKIFEDENIFK